MASDFGAGDSIRGDLDASSVVEATTGSALGFGVSTEFLLKICEVIDAVPLLAGASVIFASSISPSSASIFSEVPSILEIPLTL